MDRFFAPDARGRDEFELDPVEGRHLARVLRKRVGDTVEVFDGAGGHTCADVVAIDREVVTLRTAQPWADEEAGVPAVTLAASPPKGDRLKTLVEKATELGVERFVPLSTDRSVVSPGTGKLDRLRQTVIAACKQCGRNRLMEVSGVTEWGRFVDEETEGTRLLVAHPGGGALSGLAFHGRPLTLAVGPEGGFTDAEISRATAAGAEIVSLGANVLRIETAAIGFAAAVLLFSSRTDAT